MATTATPPIGGRVTAHLTSGSSLTGTLCTYEAKDSVNGPTGLAILRENGSGPGKSNYYFVGADLIDQIGPVEAISAKTDLPPLPQIPPQKQAAVNREAEAAESFERERRIHGACVTRTAQELFNLFHRQLPNDTRWYSPDESQDLVVLGIRVKFPYQGAGCCAIEEPDGTKSLNRISNMVAKLLPLASGHNAV